MPTIVEVIQAASGGGDDALAMIQLLENHRRNLARSFLTSTEPEPGLAARLHEVVALATAAFPWDPVAEDYELAQAIQAQLAAQAAPQANVLMAAMALAPAHHFPSPPRLALVPQWLRPLYAHYLLGRAPIFLHPGEADRYAAHGAMAMAALHAAIFDDRLADSAELADAVCAADCTTIYFNAQSLKPYFRAKARITEWALLGQGRQLGYGFPPVASGARKIGVLHRTLAPGTETFHLLAHLEGRDRAASKVIVYFLDAAPNAPTSAFEPWVDEFVHLPPDMAAAVERIRADQLDLCIMTNNLGWGLTRETTIAAHRLARVQVVSGACPATPGFSSSDLFLSSRSNDPSPEAQDDYAEGLAFLPGAVGHFAYAHDVDPATLTCSRASFGIPEDQVFFFSGANYYKITPELLSAWAEILARTPGSTLGLMPFNPNWGANYPLALFLRRLNRLLARFGVAPNRVRLIRQVPTRADLLAIMALADVYLDSFPYSGACSLVDPLLVGLPIVEQAGSRLRTAQGGGLLRAEGLADAVCADTESYVDRAVRLASDPAFLDQERRRARAVSSAGPACLRTESFARSFDRFCADAIASAAAHVAGLRRASEQSLRAKIAETAKRALVDPPPTLRRMAPADLVGQALVPYLPALRLDGGADGAVLSLGEGQAGLAAPFAAVGFRVETGAQPAPMPKGFDVVAIDADLPGSDVLLGLDLAAAAPRVVVARFDTRLPRQSAGDLRRVVADADALGYPSVLFQFRRPDDGGPPHQLVDIALDANGLGDSQGLLMLYRRGETTLLTCLVQLFEANLPAPSRPAFAAARGEREPKRAPSRRKS